jgi:hypothetical protein
MVMVGVEGRARLRRALPFHWGQPEALGAGIWADAIIQSSLRMREIYERRLQRSALEERLVEAVPSGGGNRIALFFTLRIDQVYVRLAASLAICQTWIIIEALFYGCYRLRSRRDHGG